MGVCVMRHVSDAQRRFRIGTRHALAPAWRCESVEAATRAMTALHATDAPSVHLSAWARVNGMPADAVQRAIQEDRSLVKQLAMRRTVFVVPRDLLPAVWASASARVATMERARIRTAVEAAGIASDGDAWLEEARAAVLATIAEAPGGLFTADVRQAVPMLATLPAAASSDAWSASRVLLHLGATADIVRGATIGFPWDRARWMRTETWLGERPGEVEAAAGWRELVWRWLATFGPGIEEDIVWWLGATKAIVRQALREVGAVAVSLDGGAVGWLLPGDEADDPDPGDWVALLPVLDPTVMGWKTRDFFLRAHGRALFDTRGNAGTTAWVNGRAVGCWVQDERGVVTVRLLEPVPDHARRALDAEAERLTAWLDGIQIRTGYRSLAMRG